MSEREFEAYLAALAKLTGLSPAQRDAIAQELRDHMESRLEALYAEGLDRDAAIDQALEDFGDANLLARNLAAPKRQALRRRLVNTSLATAAVAALAVVLTTSLLPANNPGAAPPATAQAPGEVVPAEAAPAVEALPAAEASPGMERRIIDLTPILLLVTGFDDEVPYHDNATRQQQDELIELLVHATAGMGFQYGQDFHKPQPWNGLMTVTGTPPALESLEQTLAELEEKLEQRAAVAKEHSDEQAARIKAQRELELRELTLSAVKKQWLLQGMHRSEAQNRVERAQQEVALLQIKIDELRGNLGDDVTDEHPDVRRMRLEIDKAKSELGLAKAGLVNSEKLLRQLTARRDALDITLRLSLIGGFRNADDPAIPLVRELTATRAMYEYAKGKHEELEASPDANAISVKWHSYSRRDQTANLLQLTNQLHDAFHPALLPEPKTDAELASQLDRAQGMLSRSQTRLSILQTAEFRSPIATAITEQDIRLLTAKLQQLETMPQAIPPSTEAATPARG